MDIKFQKYAKTKSTTMKAAPNTVFGSAKKTHSLKGPHLKQGKGTPFLQGNVDGSFSNPTAHPGHAQKINLTRVQIGKQ